MQSCENGEERAKDGLGCGNEVEFASVIPAWVLLALLDRAAGLERVIHLGW